MFVKRYIAKDMSEAMEKIRSELGPEAVILSHRSVRPRGVSGLLKKKIVEVTVAYEPGPDKPIGLEQPPAQTIASSPLVAEPRSQQLPLRQAVIQSEGAPLPVMRQEARSKPRPEPRPESRPATHAPAATPSALPMQGVMQYQQAAIQARYPAPQGAPAQVGAAAVAAAIPAPAAAPAPPPQTEEQRMLDFFRTLAQQQSAAEQGQAPAQAQAQTAPQAPSAPAHTHKEAPPAPAEPEVSFEAAQFPRLTTVSEPAERPGSDARIDALNTRLAELQGVVRSLTARILTADKEGLLQFSPEITKIYNTLLEQDVQADLARSICEQVQSATEEGGGRPAATTRKLLLRMLGEPAPLSLPEGRQAVVMLTGPTGVGKTTTLVKLAGMYALREGAKVGLINTDTYRVAAQAQLRAYAEILDIPCATVYSPDELPLAMHSLSDCDLVLIDTAGKSTADLLYQEELKSLLSESRAHEVLLHISASMSPGAAAELVRYFSFMEGYKLVITKLDEMQTWGCLLNIAALAKRPLAFITTGQKVPQDIEIPDMLRIADLIMESAGV